MVPRGTMMLIETRHTLPLVLHLADTTSCTICVIVQDGIDLIAQVLENKAVVALLNVLVVSLLNIVL